MDIICLGEALIDFFATQSGLNLKDVTDFKRIAGGAPANVAVGCCRLGKKAAFIGRVGNDEFGFYLRDILSKNGVNIEMLQFDNHTRTGLVFIGLPSPTTREFLFFRNPSADMKIEPDLLNINSIQNTKIFHFGSITLISEPSRTATMIALKAAKNAGALISYDPNLRIMLWPDKSTAKKQILKAITLTDILKVNDEELEFITDLKDRKKAIKKIFKFDISLCLVTLGEKGSYYATKNFDGFFPSYNVNTIDSTGCGDSFVSAMLSELCDKNFTSVIKEKKELLSIVKIATAAASITSTKKGVISALPYKKELNDFIKNLK